MKERIISIGLTVILLFGVVPMAYAGENEIFSDLSSSNWAYKAVNSITEKGIVKGYLDGTFKPNKTVTYAEFIKMASVADTGKDLGVSDEGHWASNYYNQALEEGYFDRADIPYINLDKEIPRGDMALITSNVIGDMPQAMNVGYDDTISDVSTTTKYEYHIKKVYAEGIITGYPDNTFKPDQTLSRAEAATVIYRLIDKSARILPNLEHEEDVEELIPEVEQKTYTVDPGTAWEGVYKYVKGKLGDYGIEEVRIDKGYLLGVVSNEKYYYIEVVLNQKSQGLVGNVDGTNYWIKDSKYLYTNKINNCEGEFPLVLMLSGPKEQKCVEFTDFTVKKIGEKEYKLIKH